MSLFGSKLPESSPTLYKESPHATESKAVLDSGFHAMDSGFQSLSVELGLLNLIVSGISSCIPDSKAKDPGFQEQNVIEFWIPRTKFSRSTDSTSKIFPNSGFNEQKFPGFRNMDSLTWGEKRVSGDKKSR